MTHPYKNLSPKAFWRTSMANRSLFDMTDLWDSKFSFTSRDTFFTLGSCFAQHFSKSLVKNGLKWMDTEPRVKLMTKEFALQHHYGVFSARVGNVYTTGMLRQWAQWARQEAEPDHGIMEKNGRYFDAFRQSVEPEGFSSKDDLLKSRHSLIRAIKKGIEKSSVLVFTMGLTETWYHKNDNYEFSNCPGVLAGEFDSKVHGFKNVGFNECYKELKAAIELFSEINPNLKVLLTVSPVPLVATASGKSVLEATVYSKSVLRAVAGEICSDLINCDYFPSFEIISGIQSRSTFYNPNLRDVNQNGVQLVMKNFFRGQPELVNPKLKASQQQQSNKDGNSSDEVVCEELLLDAFQGSSK